MLYRLLFAGFIALPAPALGVGTMEETKPVETETSVECDVGQIYDPKTKACSDLQDSGLDDDTLFEAVRELAYAGSYDRALEALDAMSEGDSDRVLTYRGFIARKMGDVAQSMAYYRTALAQNPDNLMARSYLGQGFLATGDVAAARAQLLEINKRGGRQTWAAIALKKAIARGAGYSY